MNEREINLSKALANCITALCDEGVDSEYIAGLISCLGEEAQDFLEGAGISSNEAFTSVLQSIMNS